MLFLGKVQKMKNKELLIAERKRTSGRKKGKKKSMTMCI
jgi:hypothetical protein